MHANLVNNNYVYIFFKNFNWGVEGCYRKGGKYSLSQKKLYTGICMQKKKKNDILIGIHTKR